MDQKFLMNGNVLLQVLIEYPDLSSEIIENSALMEYALMDIGEILLKRSRKAKTEEEKNFIMNLGGKLSRIGDAMEQIPPDMEDFQTVITIGIYKKIDFSDCVDIWTAKNSGLILITNKDAVSALTKDLGFEAINLKSEDFKEKFREVLMARKGS